MRLSNRTRDLPPLTGPAAWIRELRYHEGSRQVMAFVLILIYTITIAHPGPIVLYVGFAIAILGLVFRLFASGYINKNAELATGGPYALVRHPLYTGNILTVVGFALASGTWWALPLALFFFWFYYPPTIGYEDNKLHGLFGSAWEQWAGRTPALLPSFGNLSAVGKGHWSIRKSFMQNGEIVIVVFAAVCLIAMAHRAL